jgi:hypothetical protein
MDGGRRFRAAWRASERASALEGGAMAGVGALPAPKARVTVKKKSRGGLWLTRGVHLVVIEEDVIGSRWAAG